MLRAGQKVMNVGRGAVNPIAFVPKGITRGVPPPPAGARPSPFSQMRWGPVAFYGGIFSISTVTLYWLMPSDYIGSIRRFLTSSPETATAPVTALPPLAPAPADVAAASAAGAAAPAVQAAPNPPVASAVPSGPATIFATAVTSSIAAARNEVAAAQASSAPVPAPAAPAASSAKAAALVTNTATSDAAAPASASSSDVAVAASHPATEASSSPQVAWYWRMLGY